MATDAKVLIDSPAWQLELGFLEELIHGPAVGDAHLLGMSHRDDLVQRIPDQPIQHGFESFFETSRWRRPKSWPGSPPGRQIGVSVCSNLSGW